MDRIAIWGSRLTLGNMLVLGRYMKESLPYEVSVQLYRRSSGNGKLYDFESLSKDLGYYYWIDKDYEIIVKNLLMADHLIVVSDSAWKYLKKIMKSEVFLKIQKKFGLKSNRKTTALVCTAGGYLRDHRSWNKMMIKHNIQPYIMPDLFGREEIDHIPYYHAVDVSLLDSLSGGAIYPDSKKNFIISHSPGDSYRIKNNIKGTKQIIEAVDMVSRKYPHVSLKIIKNKSWKECIKIKSLSHIFIDQVIKGNKSAQKFYNSHSKNVRYKGKKIYEGGLGKSGLEALPLPCVTICGGSNPHTEEFFPSPPINFISASEIYEKIIYYVENEDVRRDHSRKERDWSIKYLNSEFISKHLTRHIAESHNNNL